VRSRGDGRRSLMTPERY